MIATLGTAAVSRARLQIPRYGAAMADGQLLDASALVSGSRATLTIGDLSMVGTIRPGTGAFGGITGFSWIAGGDGWSNTVDRRHTPPHDDAGVMLSAVAKDLAVDAREIGVVLGVPDRQLGQDWTRPKTLARNLLDALAGGEWWVATDGITHIGPRPASSTSSPTLTVDPYDPELRHGVCRLADDAIAGLLPGATLAAQGLPAPVALGATVVHLEGASLTVEFWGERSGAEIFAALVDALTAWRLYLRANPYQVATVGSDGRVAVRPADARSVAMPDAPALSHVPGIPGASFVLQPGAGVVVEHLAGDPGSPVVTGYPAGILPLSLLLDAASSISLGAGGTPLAIASKADTNDGALLAGVNAALGALSLPLIALEGSTAATKAKGV